MLLYVLLLNNCKVVSTIIGQKNYCPSNFSIRDLPLKDQGIIYYRPEKDLETCLAEFSQEMPFSVIKKAY